MIKDAEDNKEKDAITKKRINALSTLKNYMESVKNVLKDLEKQTDSSVSKVSDE
jgi:molecular chaperone DnaK (HSP70)